MKSLFFWVFVLVQVFTFASCGQGHEHGKDEHADHNHGTEQAATAAAGSSFGQKVEADKAWTTSELIGKLDAKADFKELTLEEDAKAQGLAAVTVKGEVTEVCQMAGCWFTLKTEDGKEVFVRVRDHAFAMPKDLSGKTIVAQGDAYTRLIPVEELRHYAEDANASKEEIEAITQPETKYELLINGASIL